MERLYKGSRKRIFNFWRSLSLLDKNIYSHCEGRKAIPTERFAIATLAIYSHCEGREAIATLARGDLNFQFHICHIR